VVNAAALDKQVFKMDYSDMGRILLMSAKVVLVTVSDGHFGSGFG